jgi:predicted nucleotidyltransferase
VVGGLAVSARTEPRFTRDVDVCVAADDDQAAERLVRSLQSSGYRVLALVEQEAAGRLAAVRLGVPGASDEGVLVDLLVASSGIEHEVVASAERMELFQGLDAPIATVPALIALKVLSRDDARRPQDRVDLVALLGVASPGHMASAGAFLALIDQRGFARGRDLLGALERLRAELGA